jgi:hypothetical protein
MGIGSSNPASGGAKYHWLLAFDVVVGPRVGAHAQKMPTILGTLSPPLLATSDEKAKMT